MTSFELGELSQAFVIKNDADLRELINKTRRVIEFLDGR